MTLKKSQCSTSSGFCFGRTLLPVTWLGLLSAINVDEIKRRGKGRTWMPENAGESCTSGNIQIRAGKSVFSTRAGREGEEAARFQKSQRCSCIKRPLGATIESKSFRLGHSCCIFPPFLTMEGIIPTQPCEALWCEYPNLRLHSIKAC